MIESQCEVVCFYSDLRMSRHIQACEFGLREVEGMEDVQKPEGGESTAKTLKKPSRESE